ncbi:hypothetical protein KIN20_022605 [Parelaphostrongylus tenuis]|uniref:Uncharacterized protein n=1 Tax=Parelaphostrongylus tenuis TaxID=148309 RepID=A0AAD5QWV3_PARTN|nr:hypothetical protein KIN20_022605 [Parelaphostrongylus tenuis]
MKVVLLTCYKLLCVNTVNDDILHLSGAISQSILIEYNKDEDHNEAKRLGAIDWNAGIEDDDEDLVE